MAASEERKDLNSYTCITMKLNNVLIMKLLFHALWIRLSISEDYLERCENICNGVL